jgi:hypothetical protein
MYIKETHMLLTQALKQYKVFKRQDSGRQIDFQITRDHTRSHEVTHEITRGHTRDLTRGHTRQRLLYPQHSFPASNAMSFGDLGLAA